MTHPATAPEGCLPDFLVIGATKAGSTSLHAYLRRHADVFAHPRRELRFFTEEHNWRRGPDWYAAQFAEAPPGTVAGEVSGAYTRHPIHEGAAERAAALIPRARLVYVLREPFAPASGHTIADGCPRATSGAPPRRRSAPTRATSRRASTALQLAEWRRHFPAEQMLVLRYEDLLADPEPSLRRLCEHLRVPYDPSIPFRVEATSRRGPGRVLARGPRGAFGGPTHADRLELSHELRAGIADLFDEDRRLLAELAGPAAATWPGAHSLPVPGRTRLRRAPGLAEAPAAWIGAALAADADGAGAGAGP